MNSIVLVSGPPVILVDILLVSGSLLSWLIFHWFQALALVDIVGRFNWTYVSTIASEGQF